MKSLIDKIEVPVCMPAEILRGLQISKRCSVCMPMQRGAFMTSR